MVSHLHAKLENQAVLFKPPITELLSLQMLHIGNVPIRSAPDTSKVPLVKNFSISIKACAHWHGLPHGRSLARSQDLVQSDVTHGIKCKFTHWHGLMMLSDCVRSDVPGWIWPCETTRSVKSKWNFTFFFLFNKRVIKLSQTF